MWETNVGNGVVSAEFDRKDIEMNKLVDVIGVKIPTIRYENATSGARIYLTHREGTQERRYATCEYLPTNRDIFTCDVWWKRWTQRLSIQIS